MPTSGGSPGSAWERHSSVHLNFKSLGIFPIVFHRKETAIGKSILSVSSEIATANIYGKLNCKKQLTILVNNFRECEKTVHGQLGVLQFKSNLTLSKERELQVPQVKNSVPHLLKIKRCHCHSSLRIFLGL